MTAVEAVGEDLPASDGARRVASTKVEATGHEPAAIESAQLLSGGREVVILHRGERYRLRLTQSGKLILTK